MFVLPVIIWLLMVGFLILLVTQVIMPAMGDKNYFWIINRSTWFKPKEIPVEERDAADQLEVATEAFDEAKDTVNNVLNKAKEEKKEVERTTKDATKLKKKLKKAGTGAGKHKFR